MEIINFIRHDMTYNNEIYCFSKYNKMKLVAHKGTSKTNTLISRKMNKFNLVFDRVWILSQYHQTSPHELQKMPEINMKLIFFENKVT